MYSGFRLLLTARNRQGVAGSQSPPSRHLLVDAVDLLASRPAPVPEEPLIVRLLAGRKLRRSEAGKPRFRYPSGHLACSEVVVRGGVEPPTFRFSGGRSYRLSYLTVARCRACAPTAAVLTGFEPATSTLTGWRALQLLYRTMLPRPLFLARKSISPTLLWLPRRRTPSWREEPRAPNGTRRRRRPPAPPKQYHRQTRGLSPTSGCPTGPGSQVPPTGFEPVPPP